MAKECDYPKLVMPAGVRRESVRVWSNGVALDADIYRPTGLGPQQRVPGVVLSHGWGGSKATGERYAARFAAAGMVSLCFTYNGWDGSAGSVVLVGEAPRLDERNEGVARIRVIRELVDPIEWIQNYRSAVDYLEGEPNVDPARLGAWGTSFGGGIALNHAANDPRIKALAVQVASLAPVLKGPLLALARQRAIDIARGTIAPVPQGIDAYPPLPGTPHLARLLQYDAMQEVGKLDVPTSLIDAGDEELFDIKANGGRARDILQAKGTMPVQYRVIPGIDHYGIYFDGFEESSDRALGWFRRYL